jgi:hypothetical protein
VYAFLASPTPATCPTDLLIPHEDE